MRRLITNVLHAAVATLLLALSPAVAAPLSVAVVISQESAAHVEVADTIAGGVTKGGGTSRVLALTQLSDVSSVNTDVIVAVGLKAAEAVARLDTRIPVINTLIPRISHERIAARAGNSGLSAVFLDQPLARQLDLIRVSLPEGRRVGAILGPDSEGAAESLSAEARARGMELRVVRVADETQLSSALHAMLGDVDVLLSLPDAVVFNPRTIQNILFSAYRRRVPVIGFSPAYVRAGALMSVHTTPAQLGRQVSELLSRSGVRAAFSPPQYPEYFSVAINEHVARSLEIKLEREDALETKLRTSRQRP